MRYSVCIPHKNDVKRLSRLIESIPLRKDIEIIIVDDHSKSSAYNNIKQKYLRWKPERNISLQSLPQNRKTAGAAMNLALKIAKAEWVLFAGSDDYYTVGAFSHFDRAISKYPETVLHQFNMNAKKDNGQPSGRVDYTNFLIKQAKSHQDSGNYKILKSILLRISSACSRLINRNWIEAEPIEFEEIPVSNDVVFSCRLIINAPSIKVFDKEVYTVTDRKGSLTSDVDFEHIGIRLQATHRSNYYQQNSAYSDTQSVIGAYILQMGKRNLLRTIKWVIYGLKIDDPWFYPINRYIKALFMPTKTRLEKRLWITLGIHKS